MHPRRRVARRRQLVAVHRGAFSDQGRVCHGQAGRVAQTAGSQYHAKTVVGAVARVLAWVAAEPRPDNWDVVSLG